MSRSGVEFHVKDGNLVKECGLICVAAAMMPADFVFVVSIFDELDFVVDCILRSLCYMKDMNMEQFFGTSLGVYSTLIFLILLGRAVLVILGSAISSVFNKMYGFPRITYKDQVLSSGMIASHLLVAVAFYWKLQSIGAKVPMVINHLKFDMRA
ncbi:hypothetical protein IFM89_005936 [Coptis chinensis]|uniref:Uncharacterized protein n=1 Tax=Coptis chinensis TaxID=261450 RepID=A0A835LZC8_9MAGN|nr:hypothetical protein IFM89_005936 [Coptis chinensis]